MRKLLVSIILLFIGVMYSSCTPESIVDEIKEGQVCCGETGEITPPPPPPPPPPGDDLDG